MFDFRLRAFDVWNSFAVAILVAQTTDYLIGLREKKYFSLLLVDLNGFSRRRVCS